MVSLSFCRLAEEAPPPAQGSTPAKWPACSLPHPEHSQHMGATAAGVAFSDALLHLYSLEQKTCLWFIGDSCSGGSRKWETDGQ